MHEGNKFLKKLLSKEHRGEGGGEREKEQIEI